MPFCLWVNSRSGRGRDSRWEGMALSSYGAGEPARYTICPCHELEQVNGDGSGSPLSIAVRLFSCGCIFQLRPNHPGQAFRNVTVEIRTPSMDVRGMFRDQALSTFVSLRKRPRSYSTDTSVHFSG